MISSAWHNGHNLVGLNEHGIKISATDRDQFISRECKVVTLVLGNAAGVEISLAPSFWRKCSRYRCVEIGRWFIDAGVASWPGGKSPRINVEQLGGVSFSARLLSSS